MDQLAQGVRHFADSFADRIGSISHLTTTQLLWGLIAAAVLLPAAAYVWWLSNPVAFSLPSHNLNSKNTAVKIEQSAAPAKIDTELHAESDGAAEPASTPNSSEARNDNAQNINVHVNGEQVPVPPSGTIHKEISHHGGNTSVDISVQSNTSGTSHSQSNTSMNIELNSKTSSETDDAG